MKVFYYYYLREVLKRYKTDAELRKAFQYEMLIHPEIANEIRSLTMQELTAQVIGVIPNLTREQAEKMQNASYLTDAIEAAENVAGFEADRVMSVFTPSEADSDLIPGVLMAARHAVLGLLAKDSIPGEYFDSLTEPWVRAVGPLTLNEVSIGEPHTPTEEEIADLGAPDDSTSDDPNATPGMREGEGFPDAPTDGSSDIADLPTSNEATDGTTDK